MQECEVQSWLGLRRRCLWVARVSHAGCARGLQEESAMRIEGGWLGGMDDHFGGRVAVGNVDGSAAILVLEPRVSPQQASARLFLRPPLLVPCVGSVACSYDGQEQGDGGQKLGGVGRASDTSSEECDIMVVESQ